MATALRRLATSWASAAFLVPPTLQSICAGSWKTWKTRDPIQQSPVQLVSGQISSQSTAFLSLTLLGHAQLVFLAPDPCSNFIPSGRVPVLLMCLNPDISSHLVRSDQSGAHQETKSTFKLGNVKSSGQDHLQRYRKGTGKMLRNSEASRTSSEGTRGRSGDRNQQARLRYGRLRAAGSSGQAHREGGGGINTPSFILWPPADGSHWQKATAKKRKGVFWSCPCRSASRSPEQIEEGWRADLEEQMEAAQHSNPGLLWSNQVLLVASRSSSCSPVSMAEFPLPGTRPSTQHCRPAGTPNSCFQTSLPETTCLFTWDSSCAPVRRRTQSMQDKSI